MITSPLVEELRSYWATESVPFHMPGHKGGSGAAPLAREILGIGGFKADVSEIGGFDYLHDPRAGLRASQELAASIFGAQDSFFLINGSTGGNIAALLSVVGDGDNILVSRMSHRSVFAGLALTGAVPIYIDPLYDSVLGGYLGMDVQPAYEDLKATILRDKVKAIHLTRPSYYGLCNDISLYTTLATECGIPLLVDEAHGAHFAFHPAFPPSAMSLGADLVIQSIHKTLGSLTQSSILHLGSEKVNKSYLQQVLTMTQSSSPSVLLLLSLDITCSYMAQHGQEAFEEVIELAEITRDQINQIDGLYCYGEEILGKSGLVYLDPTKLIIDVSRLNITGFEAARWLKEYHNIAIEMSDLRRVLCTVTVGDTEERTAYLLQSLSGLAQYHIGHKNAGNCVTDLDRLPNAAPPVLSLRKAFQSPRKTIPMSEAVGEVSGEYIVIYPPGIPLIAPGEILTQQMLDYLLQVRQVGGRITGLSDPTLTTIDIIE